MDQQAYGRRHFIKHSALGLAFWVGEKRASATTAPQKIKNGIIYRTLGRTGMDVPIVSMGLFLAKDPDLLRASYEQGVRHFDTAHGYQGGRSEELLGATAKAWPRDQLCVATKVSPKAATTPEEYLAKLDISLQRLQMDYVDILYLHSVNKPETLTDECYVTALQKAKQQGKARAIGVSLHDPVQDLIPVAVKAGCYEVIMSAYNFRQEQRAAVLAQARAAQTAGVGMVAMKTMAGRFLDKEKTKPVNCAAALKWALRDPAFTTAIPGYTTFDQMEENVAVLRNLALSAAEEQSLQTAMTSGPGLACDMCGRCNGQCPRGVPVADLMRSYMYSYGYESPALAREEICSLGMDTGPLPCLDCATCAVRCARGFNVQARALDIVRLREIPADFLA